VRFITPQPNLTTFSTYARAEIADTDNGAPSYEAGIAEGGPIVPEKLGLRISAWYREDGGGPHRHPAFLNLGTTMSRDRIRKAAWRAIAI
jgi:hypothetical protein